MILFRPEHAPLILDGTKTQTRRLWAKCRVKVGAIHQCYTRPAFVKVNPGKPFARVEIVAVRQEELSRISTADAAREGYGSIGEYITAFREINGWVGSHAGVIVWVVDFKLAEAIGG